METHSYTTDEARWAAVVARDQAAESAFLYGVTTTGIYCRPGCASRPPRRENVRFFASSAEAEQQGLRPCKRCTPQVPDVSDPNAALIARACDLIAQAETPPTLDELAAAVGVSPFHFHRLFKQAVGVTPRQYAQAQRQQRVREHLRSAPTVTDALLDAGFASSSRFYESSAPTLGMTPTAYRAGGSGEQIRFACAPTYLGWVLVAATERGLCAIEIGDDPATIQARLRAGFPQATFEANDPAFAAVVADIVALIEQPACGTTLALDVQGTAFQQRVWAALREIPAGATVSYAELAARIGQPSATRAVAHACAANTLAVAIPCHRVVRSNGDLSGYRWGVERKRALLAREAEQATDG